MNRGGGGPRGRLLLSVLVLLSGRVAEGDPKTLSEEAYALFEKGKYEEAEKKWLETLGEVELGSVDEVKLRKNLAKLYLKMGQWGKARIQCEKGAKIAKGPGDRQWLQDQCPKKIDEAEAAAKAKPAEAKPAEAKPAKGKVAERPKRVDAPPSATVPVGGKPPAAAPVVVPEGMVLIQGGSFNMGSNEGEADEKPVHRVTLQPFLMDRTEVTVDAYARCVGGGRCQEQKTTNYEGAPSGKDNTFWSQLCNYGKPGWGNHPMNCVDHGQATAYCAYAGKRLPTEAEWEYAARGKGGRIYPWGGAPPGPTLLNACGEECQAWAKRNGMNWGAMYPGKDPFETTAPVGSFPQGATPEGLQDMAGNVWEWVQDAYAPCYDKVKCSVGQTRRVLRGASWSIINARFARASYRFGNTATERGNVVGFRCAQDTLR